MLSSAMAGTFDNLTMGAVAFTAWQVVVTSSPSNVSFRRSTSSVDQVRGLAQHPCVGAVGVALFAHRCPPP